MRTDRHRFRYFSKRVDALSFLVQLDISVVAIGHVTSRSGVSSLHFEYKSSETIRVV